MGRSEWFSRRWPSSAKALLIVAGVCGLLAFLMVRGYAARIQAMDPGAPVTVSVAGRDLARGTIIDDSMVRSRQMPSAYVPQGAVPSARQALGRVLLARITAGEIITTSRLSSAAGGAVAGLVPDGLRAVLIPSRLPADAVAPGDRVDIIAAASGQGYSQVVGNAVEVLRVIAPDVSGDAGLIIAASPEEAEAIAQAAALADTLAVTIIGAGDRSALFLAEPSPTPLP